MMKRYQIKSKWYYIFWGAMTASVVGALGVNTYTNYKLTQSTNNYSEQVRDYLLIKPFPILCRGQLN